jgi:ribose transport system ATP-binding protein
VVAASSKIEEMGWIWNRIAVMHRGRVAALIDRADATKENIMTAAATGVAWQGTETRPEQNGSPT